MLRHPLFAGSSFLSKLSADGRHAGQRRGAFGLVCLAALSCAISGVDAAAAAAAQPAAPPRDLPKLASAAWLPLYFEQNEGQADPSVQFIGRAIDHTVYLREQGATIALPNPKNAKPGRRPGAASDDGTDAMRLVHVTFPGAVLKRPATGEEKQPGKINYLLGNDPALWRQNVATFGQVRYREIYPRIDLIYYGNERQLEFD